MHKTINITLTVVTLRYLQISLLSQNGSILQDLDLGPDLDLDLDHHPSNSV